MRHNGLIGSLSARPGLWAFLIAASALALRLWFVATGQLGLVQDEAQYWDWTRTMQLTYYSKGPLIAWIIASCTTFFGDTELGVRLGSILGAALFPALVWLLVAKLWRSPLMAVLAVFVITVSPLFQALGILMTTDNPFVICWTLCMLALYAATTQDEQGQDRGLWPYALLALAYGVGILAKYTMLGLAGLAFAYALLLHRQGALPRRFWPRLVLALGLGACLGFLPTLIWNMQNDFVGYKHVLHLIGVTGKASHASFRISRVFEYVGAQLGFALPWWYVLALLAGWRAALQAWRPNAAYSASPGALNLQQSTLLAVFFWPMTLFFLAWSFHTKVLANWNAVSFVAGSLLCAAELHRLLVAGPSQRAWKWLKTGAWASLALLLFVHLHQFLPVPQSLNPAHRLKGWQDLGQHMRSVADTRFPDPSRVFFMSDVYDITAELAFYVPGQPRAYCLWWDGRRMNQYDLWGGPKGKEGWDAILVLRGDSPSVPPVATEMFASVSGPYRYVASFRGQPVRPFYYYLCMGYNGSWPRQDTGAF